MENEQKIKRQKQPLNDRNPLTIYKNKKGFDWEKISEQTGLSISTLIRIARKDKEHSHVSSYYSVNKLKTTIGVDVIAGWSK